MLTPGQGHLILAHLKPFHAWGNTDAHEYEKNHTYADMYQVSGDKLKALNIQEEQLRDHAGGFYCGTDMHKERESVHVFQRSQLLKFLGLPNVLVGDVSIAKTERRL